MQYKILKKEIKKVGKMSVVCELMPHASGASPKRLDSRRVLDDLLLDNTVLVPILSIEPKTVYTKASALTCVFVVNIKMDFERDGKMYAHAIDKQGFWNLLEVKEDTDEVDPSDEEFLNTGEITVSHSDQSEGRPAKTTKTRRKKVT